MKDNTVLERHLKAAAEAVKQFTGGLIAEVLRAVTAAQQEIAEVKADKPTHVPVLIQTTGWVKDEPEEPEGDEEDMEEHAYPWHYDIPVKGLTSKDRADVTVEVNSLEAATACGLCPTTEATEGKITLRASSVPEQEIRAEYWIVTGRE